MSSDKKSTHSEVGEVQHREIYQAQAEFKKKLGNPTVKIDGEFFAGAKWMKKRLTPQDDEYVEGDRCLKCFHTWTHEDDACPECGSQDVDCGVMLKKAVAVKIEPTPSTHSEVGEIVIQALNNIADPIKYLKDNAVKSGGILDGEKAFQLAKQPELYQDIARDALRTIQHLTPTKPVEITEEEIIEAAQQYAALPSVFDPSALRAGFYNGAKWRDRHV